MGLPARKTRERFLFFFFVALSPAGLRCFVVYFSVIRSVIIKRPPRLPHCVQVTIPDAVPFVSHDVKTFVGAKALFVLSNVHVHVLHHKYTTCTSA